MDDTTLWRVFDENDSILQTGHNFKAGQSYLVRFVLTNWEQDLPVNWQEKMLREVPGFLAAACDVTLYNVKGVALQKRTQGEAQQINSVFGNTITMPDDRSWTMDIVFEPTQNSGLTWTSVDDWTKYIARSAAINYGQPTVYLGGIAVLTDDMGWTVGADLQEQVSKLKRFWDGNQSFYQFIGGSSKNEFSECVFRTSAININGSAWSKIGFVGTDGFGFAQGSAAEPLSLQPISKPGAATPGPQPPAPEPGTTPEPGGHAVTATPVAIESSTIQTGAVFLGAFLLGYVAYTKLMEE